MVDCDFQAKTNALVQKHIGASQIEDPIELMDLNEATVEYIVNRKGNDATKVINLIKSIEKTAEDQSDDPYLVAMAERSKMIQEAFESRQQTTSETLEKLRSELEANEARKREQAERGLDNLTYFVYNTLVNEGIDQPETVAKEIKEAFQNRPYWMTSENELRELRQEVTFTIFAHHDDLKTVTSLVDDLFKVIQTQNS